MSVPGSLFYRDLLLRVVASSCKLIRCDEERVQSTGHDTLGGSDEFEAEVVSAFGEAFNNIAIHGYGESSPGRVDVEIETQPGRILIRVFDWGTRFVWPSVAPPPNALPEFGMGLFIIRSFMETVTYTPGCPPETPNCLVLSKHRCHHRDPPLV